MIDRETLFKIWDDAYRERDAARRALDHADNVLTNAKTTLVNSLIPHDAKIGETFGIWICNTLVQVTVPAAGFEGEIGVRIREFEAEPKIVP